MAVLFIIPDFPNPIIHYLAINEWVRLSRIWRIKQIEEGVIHRGRKQ